jgi:DNA mismatch repair protein MutS
VFRSILFDRPADAARAGQSREPSCFHDLNLDQVVSLMTIGRAEYQLPQFCYVPLHDAGSVRYRHEILHDLENEPVRTAVRAFASGMRDMREQLTQARKLRYKYQQERWFVDATDTYCRTVGSLAGSLAELDIGSRGFRGLRDYLGAYTSSEAFTSLVSATRTLYAGLASVTYSIHIKGNRVRVSNYDGEPDYSGEVEKTFARFKQGAVKDHRVGFRNWPEMNHVEAQILDLVARLNPELFRDLDSYWTRNQDYLDPTIASFDREVQFYLAYLELIGPLRKAALNFCYPEVSEESGDTSADSSFDLALACKLVPDKTAVVPNGFLLEGPERILVVSGPNNGGKTTFARMFGQLHYIASLGLPVPGRQARLPLADQVFTHFEREEDIITLHGKLEDELTRIHEVLGRASASSVLVMNESFTSTTLSDALFLGTEVMRQVVDLGLVGVYVTFVDELASLSDATVSMTSTVVPDNPAQRTFKVVRRPADGLAYAAAIAAKYGLTFERVKERIAP